MTEKIIYHVDVNSAFLSWEACYRMEHLGEEQDLRDLPSAVAGDSQARHGVILAKSTPAKLMGVKTGEPVWQARRKCPGLILVPANYGLYVAASRRFIALLKDYAPVVEQYSIDEAYADVTGCRRLYGDPVQAAYELKDRIHRELGFTVNVGVSCNKLLAKMAGELEKPDKVHTLFPEQIGEKMWPLPVGELFSVGPARRGRLEQIGVTTIGQLARMDLSRVKA
ncbi:MAG: DNA polymerase IV, partial [Firmicutes bacterium]|nr:DNA polymerase IV [Bacillota bacterium]